MSRKIFLHLVEGPCLNVGVWDTDGVPGEEGRAPDERGKTADNRQMSEAEHQAIHPLRGVVHQVTEVGQTRMRCPI